MPHKLRDSGGDRGESRALANLEPMLQVLVLEGESPNELERKARGRTSGIFLIDSSHELRRAPSHRGCGLKSGDLNTGRAHMRDCGEVSQRQLEDRGGACRAIPYVEDSAGALERLREVEPLIMESLGFAVNLDERRELLEDLAFLGPKSGESRSGVDDFDSALSAKAVAALERVLSHALDSEVEHTDGIDRFRDVVEESRGRPVDA
jgi:hypothetical protein